MRGFSVSCRRSTRVPPPRSNGGASGPVFADRHRTLTFEGETAGELFAYVHNNPERAGVVVDALDSPWTSHRFFAGVEEAPAWLDLEFELQLCGFSASRCRSGGLRALRAIARGLPSVRFAERRRPAVKARAAPQYPRRSGRGRESNRHTTVRRARASRCAGPADRAPATACVVRPAGVVLDAVAEASGVAAAALRSRTRVRRVAEARRLALVTWTGWLGRPTVEMARALCLADSSAAALLNRSSDAMLQQAAATADALWRSEIVEIGGRHR